MSTFLSINGLVVYVVLAGLATKQMSYILINGSIFHRLRQSIEDRASDGSSLFSKIHALFTCKLCMSAQVSLWLVTLPSLVITLTWSSPLQALVIRDRPLGWNLLTVAWIWFVLAMAIAAIAVGIWNLLEFKAERFAALERKHERELRSLRRVLATGGNTDIPVVIGEDFTLEDLTELAEEVRAKCGWIFCPIKQEYCRRTVCQHFFKTWARRNRPNSIEATTAFLEEKLEASTFYRIFSRSMFQRSSIQVWLRQVLDQMASPKVHAMD